MQELFEALKTHSLVLATAESCTGGMIAAALTDIPGSSAVFDRGFVTYTNKAKEELLGVPHDVLAQHGAVSAPVAKAMASGALAHSDADIAVSCTGIAGPGGATATKPVGLVYIGVDSKTLDARSFEHHFEGDRPAVRAKTVDAARLHLLDIINTQSGELTCHTKKD